jgi:hypothetical protein
MSAVAVPAQDRGFRAGMVTAARRALAGVRMAGTLAPHVLGSIRFGARLEFAGVRRDNRRSRNAANEEL